MTKYLIATTNKEIPYKKILHEIPTENIGFVVPDTLLASDAKSSFSSGGTKVYEIKNYFQGGLIEKVCYDIYQQFPYDRLIAHTEKDLLWAGKLRELLKIEGQQYLSALAFRDKFIMKNIAHHNAIKTPYFAKIESSSDLLHFSHTYGFPFIVKPCRESFSIGIKILKNINDLNNFIRENLNIKHESIWLAETYIRGEMYQVDGIIKDGQAVFVWPSKSVHHWLDITSAQVVGRYFLEPYNALIPRLNDYAISVASCFPMEKNAIFHLEFFHEADTDDLVFCEIASRVGGARGRDIWINSFKVDLGAEFIRSQAGLPFSCLDSMNRLPMSIDGYLLFPIKKGVLKKNPLMCNVPGVKEYKKFLEDGLYCHSSQNLSQIACLVTLSAESEKHFQAKTKHLMNWYEKEFEWRES